MHEHTQADYMLAIETHKNFGYILMYKVIDQQRKARAPLWFVQIARKKIIN